MFGRKSQMKLDESGLDLDDVVFFSGRVLLEYLLPGRLKKSWDSYILISDRDRDGNEIAFNLSIEDISKIFFDNRSEHRKGLSWRRLGNPYHVLETCQWMANMHYDDRPEFFVRHDDSSRFALSTYKITWPHQRNSGDNDLLCIINNYTNEWNIFNAGPFQLDKIGGRCKVISSDVSSEQMDAMIRDLYEGHITEYNHDNL
ncbi:MAG: hypothetical protein ACLFPQ_03965 [Candidatus Woesearchaeota archaeon]